MRIFKYIALVLGGLFVGKLLHKKLSKQTPTADELDTPQFSNEVVPPVVNQVDVAETTAKKK